MVTRGRRNIVELSVLSATTVPPPDPPEKFSEAEKAAWMEVVGSMPGDWLRLECRILLRQLCCHMMLVDELDDRIRELVARRASHEEIKPLADMRRDESTIIGQIASKLRLTPQARYWPQKGIAAERRAAARPWAMKD